MFGLHFSEPPRDAQAFPAMGRESDYYKGVCGSKYFAWQSKNAAVTAALEAKKFSKFVKPTDAVLDFGCGGGHILQSLVCARRVGVEVNPFARAAAIHAGIECYESLEQVGTQLFQVVISHHALEHVEQPIAVLRQLRTKLAKGGKLVLYLPIDDWRTQKQYDPADVNHHLHTWTPQLLGNALFEAGFGPEELSIRIVTHALFPGNDATYKIPAPLVHAMCWIFAMVIKRRQLIAVATR